MLERRTLAQLQAQLGRNAENGLDTIKFQQTDKDKRCFLPEPTYEFQRYSWKLWEC